MAFPRILCMEQVVLFHKVPAESSPQLLANSSRHNPLSIAMETDLLSSAVLFVFWLSCNSGVGGGVVDEGPEN